MYILQEAKTRAKNCTGVKLRENSPEALRQSEPATPAQGLQTEGSCMLRGELVSVKFWAFH